MNLNITKIFISIALLSIASVVTAQDESFTSKQREVIALEKSWAEAMKTRNLDRLEEILSFDYRLAFIDREPVLRGTWLLNTMHNLKFDSINMEFHDVAVFGNTAVVSMTMHMDWKTEDGKQMPKAAKLTDTWVRTKDGWKVISRISERL